MIHIDVIKKKQCVINKDHNYMHYLWVWEGEKKQPTDSSRSCWITAACWLSHFRSHSISFALFCDQSLIKSFLTRSNKIAGLCSACAIFWRTFDMIHVKFIHLTIPLMKRIIALDSLLHFMEIHILSHQICSVYDMKGASDLSKHIITIKL